MNRTHVRFAALAAILAGAVLAAPAQAAVTFGASVTNANGSLSTKLTWSAPGASSCTGSGHAAWNGTKAASGTQDLPAITLSGSYTLTLACTFPGDNTATISWTAPTTNTDGSALAKCPDQNPGNPCLLQFKVYTSTTSPVNLAQATVRTIDDRNAVSYVWTGLTSAKRYFVVTAVNGLFAESPVSNEATKTITNASTETASVTLTVNPIPSSPTNAGAT